MNGLLFPLLFEPIRIGGVSVPNRLCFPAMHSSLGDVEDGLTDEAIDFYVARAKGGFGIVGVGVIDTYTWDFSSPLEILLRTDRHIRRHAELVKRAKSYGAVLVAQVGPRRVFHLSQLRKGVRLSSVREDVIEEMIEETVQAGLRAFEVGYDIVEIIGNGASAVSLFMSRIFNDREDAWGGDPERRCRFPLEMVRRLRQRAGRDAPISFRLHGAEFMPDGYGLEESREQALRLRDAGVVFFNVTGGSHATSVPQLTPNVPRATYAFLAREIREAVGVPVAASNRINHPFEAEEILRRGWADMVSIARGALADPDWPRKAREGRWHQIRLCIACNECQDIAGVYDRPLRCLVNPKAGRGLEVEPLLPAKRRKRVMVVGGGCGGLQAALTAAERGHDVCLYEEKPYLGGRWRVAYAPPGREELFHFLEWMVTSLQDLGVSIHLGTKVTPELVQAERPDTVILSTGIRPKVPDIPGVDLPHVHHAEEILEGTVIPGQRVVVVGAGGTGVETAAYLARRLALRPESVAFLEEFGGLLPEATWEYARSRQKVVLVGRNRRVGAGLGPATRWVLRKEVYDAGVEVLKETEVVEILEDRVRVRDREGSEQEIPADTVVLSVGYTQDRTLFEVLAPLVKEVVLLGTMDAQHAISVVGEAFETALTI